LRARLRRAEDTIAELTEISNAAQAGIDTLRERLAQLESEIRRLPKTRDTLAAALFRLTEQITAATSAPAAETVADFFALDIGLAVRWQSTVSDTGQAGN